MQHLVDWRQRKTEKLCNLHRGNAGNEKLDVQGAIFLTGFICRGVASIKCICWAFWRKNVASKAFMLLNREVSQFYFFKQIENVATYFSVNRKLFYMILQGAEALPQPLGPFWDSRFKQHKQYISRNRELSKYRNAEV